jgi:SPP1 family predicted phage head-tail adaptor
MLRAGRLRQRVTVQSRTLTKNQYHEQVETWTSGECIPADVVPFRSAEGVAGDRLETQERYRVTIRYNAAITNKHRLMWGTVPLEIHQVIDRDNRGRAMDLICSVEAT